MMAGKTENMSASYLAPTADAMRVSAERVARMKQDLQKNAAEGLLEMNAVCKLDIGDEGWARMETEKKQRTDEKGNPITDGKLDNVIVVDIDAWPEIDPENCVVYKAQKRTEEDMSLSENMFHIEESIVLAFEAAKLHDNGNCFTKALMQPGKR